MDVHIVAILGTLIAFVAITSAELQSRTKEGSQGYLVQRSLVYAVLLLSSVATGVAWTKYPLYGVVHGLATYGAMVVILVERFRSVRILQPLAVFTVLLAFVLFIVMIPVVGLPLLESPILTTAPLKPSAEGLDMAFLRVSLDNIQESLQTVRGSIDTEAERIEASISTLTGQLADKQHELENLNSERARLAEEVERYKHLASLEQEQIEAVKDLLNRRKYLEYVIGFFIGLLATILGSFLSRFIGSLRPS